MDYVSYLPKNQGFFFTYPGLPTPFLSTHPYPFQFPADTPKPPVVQSNDHQTRFNPALNSFFITFAQEFGPHINL
jgi:hypothetical protein